MSMTAQLPAQKAQIILALDVDTVERARSLVDELYPTVKFFKVGIQLFAAAGPQIVEYITRKGGSVFLDLKFFDIPNTVAQAVRQAVRMRVGMLTLHIMGDEEMMKAAIAAGADEAKRLSAQRPLLIGVTVLTSKEAQTSDVLTLARIGIKAGLDGVVCSAREAALLRREIRQPFTIVTPGIRASGAVQHDQKRTATVDEAVKAGSNFLVVGRPILEASDPKSAAERFAIS